MICRYGHDLPWLGPLFTGSYVDITLTIMIFMYRELVFCVLPYLLCISKCMQQLNLFLQIKNFKHHAACLISDISPSVDNITPLTANNSSSLANENVIYTCNNLHKSYITIIENDAWKCYHYSYTRLIGIVFIYSIQSYSWVASMCKYTVIKLLVMNEENPVDAKLNLSSTSFYKI